MLSVPYVLAQLGCRGKPGPSPTMLSEVVLSWSLEDVCKAVIGVVSLDTLDLTPLARLISFEAFLANISHLRYLVLLSSI